MPLSPPIDLQAWIEEHRHLLKPPVGNQVVYRDTEFIIMIVGGPNHRKDYHVDEGEEFFYQLEGNMVLKVIDEGKPRDIPIRAGEIFLLPPRVPHSPQREAGSIGLVVERRRRPGELDGFQWYCETCHAKLYEEFVPLQDIVSQLPEIFDRFYADPQNSTCHACGTIMERPA
ncbi:MAG: 3-hydroxyanthranilate 3,4-dioxygenase [Deltaproteobacteria bacterium]|nr:MAG: 3-hydroxyanthranilate 3,4-dioxygenase [Deltaproteobacteria bacterium]